MQFVREYKGENQCLTVPYERFISLGDFIITFHS